MDLLGSILGSMEKPPTVGQAERKKAREQKALIEKQQEKEKKRLDDFRDKIQKRIQEFIQDSSLEKLRLETMDKVFRSIVHEVADIASLASFSFGLEEEDRYVMLWKKEFAPSDEELLAYRRDEEWDPEKAKQIVQQREEERLQSQYTSSKQKGVLPQSNYQDKYKHLIGETSAKEAAQSTQTNRSYGFVSSENKRDHRTIEEVLAESRAKKKQKVDGTSSEQLGTSDNKEPTSGAEETLEHEHKSVVSSETNRSLPVSKVLKDNSASS